MYEVVSALFVSYNMYNCRAGSFIINVGFGDFLCIWSRVGVISILDY